MPVVIFGVFFFGLILGSFLNAVIFRLKSGESFLFGRSHCVNCGHELAPGDLVPVASFIFLRGKCRYCHSKLSWQYPAVELITAVVLVLLARNFQFLIFNVQFFIQATYICFLIVIAVFDLKHYLILDKLVVPIFILALANSVYQGRLASSLIGAAVVSGFFLLQYVVSYPSIIKKINNLFGISLPVSWIGLGDVKLGLFLGSITGPLMAIPLLVLSYFTGAVTGLTLVLFKKKQLSSRLPFGVFLGSSAIITILYGDKILAWYLKLIGL